ncbi:ferrous iron transporter B [Pseudaquidulcibacter saccharophilus]|uniref:ferrous iron transporter B n=1 Tax=Pseudaquidulcibacter saccharophilus TaxID=2831900 RepID=UPI001EFEFF47|nr:ferrous iron transporter B [Pseudaquidulcibacter saccharophilus]
MSLKAALIGAPNCGKSTLFNGLTGGKAKTANYAGVTVEAKKGHFTTPKGQEIELYDLPGIYGLTARSSDEKVAINMLEGQMKGVDKPDLVLVVIDAANLRTHLHSALQLRELGIPMMLILNMIDLAERDGIEIDTTILEKELRIPVVTSRATRQGGRENFLNRLDSLIDDGIENAKIAPEHHNLSELQKSARSLAARAIVKEALINKTTRIIDSVALHPIFGPIMLAVVLFLMFQAVFSWATFPVDFLDGAVSSLADFVRAKVGHTIWGELLADGIIAGVGSVIVFLPLIVILFAFILVLEASGYMTRAAFLMDEIMLRAGLNGRAFIPLLSSFACAVPGIMSTRVIEHERDRITTILIAPLMTCSARLPVYTLIIAAFIPNVKVFGFVGLQGLVMFGLYLAGVISAFVVAFILKKTVTQGAPQAFILELPTYKLPNWRDFYVGIIGAATSFLRRAGTVILQVSVILWILAKFPLSATSLRESYAGKIGAFLEPALKPIGFNIEIAIALIPGMAAREVAVGALGTIYSVQGGESNTQGLAHILQNAWSLPTALAFLAWYVFAPQCFATLATIRRETNSAKWAIFAFLYLLGIAYIAAGLTYHISRLIIGN